MILVSLFQKTMFYLMKSKYDIVWNFKVTKIERSAFFGTPSISIVWVGYSLDEKVGGYMY